MKSYQNISKNDFGWKYELNLWKAETLWQLTGSKRYYYEKKQLDKLKIHCLEERAKQLQPYRGFKTFNAFIRHRDKQYCYLCLAYIKYGESNIEHDLPIIRFGYTEENNCHDSHEKCNRAKGRMTAAEYRMKKRNI